MVANNQSAVLPYDAVGRASEARGQVRPPPFEVVYRRHVGYVFRLLRRFGVHPEDVEDAAQEVFVVVHRRLPDYDPELGTIRTWLFTLARGVAANRRRSQNRRPRVVVGVPTVDARPGPEQRAHEAQALALVQRFLETLPPERREVFELIDIEGLRGPEVAAALGVKLNTIYSRLRLARVAFKAYVATLRKTAGSVRGGGTSYA